VHCGLRPIDANGTQVDLYYSVEALHWPNKRPLFALDPDKVLPAASVAKLLIAVASLETLNLGASGASHNRLDRSQSSALRKMILVSDNAAANELIGWLTVRRINDTAALLGLTSTHIGGLFIETERDVHASALTTATDCNKLLGYILMQSRSRDAFQRSAYRSLIDLMIDQHDRRFFGSLGRVIRVADKTGEIHGEINDVAIINPFQERPLIISMLAYGPFNVYENSVLYDAAVERVSALARCLYGAAAREATPG